MSIECINAEQALDPKLVERRKLTEVHHLMNGMDKHGVIGPNVKEGVFENLVTKIQEDAMPGAVPVVVQPVAETQEENGEKRRTFIWKGLGHTALEVAESGAKYHVYGAALKRVGVEKREALRTEQHLESGTAQVIVSPKMSKQDAPRWLALQEHLADEDSLRVSTAVTDEEGAVTARRLESLLVHDIPLSAWVYMFKDPNNLWGRAFNIINEGSALSVMELFDQLDLPEAALPEGPVTLVAAVLPYIDDQKARTSVERQLTEFRSDQRRYQAEARASAAEWLQFEVALAQSLRESQANQVIRGFIVGLQNEWDDTMLALLEDHVQPNAHYSMTETLAAKLEEAKQKLLARGAKIILEAPDAIQKLGTSRVESLKREIEDVRLMQSLGYNPADIQSKQTDIMRTVAHANIKTGGGCSGINAFEFANKPKKTDSEKLLAKILGIEFEDSEDEAEDGIGKKEIARCRIELCPTRPSKTLVGGCKVCLQYCQPIFDAGGDPAVVYEATSKQDKPEPKKIPLFELKAKEALDNEDKELTRELDKLSQSDKQESVAVY